MEFVNILLQATQLEIDEAALRIVDMQQNRYVIPHEEIVLAYVAVYEGEIMGKGMRDCYIPELTDMTEDTAGTLVVYNRQQNCFRIGMDSVKMMTAGQVIKKLTRYAPHALFGFQPWVNEYDSGQFEEILEMVDIMKECTRQL